MTKRRSEKKQQGAASCGGVRFRGGAIKNGKVWFSGS